MTAPLQNLQRILAPIDFTPASDEAIASEEAIVVGDQSVEFSPASARAVTMAATLAQASDAELLFVHATPSMPYNAIYTGPVGVPTNLVEEINQRAKKASLAVLEAVRTRHCPDQKVTHIVRPGIPITVVLEEAQRQRVDLIVMAASGRTRVARFFVGSTADRIIRQAVCPVLVVPAS